MKSGNKNLPYIEPSIRTIAGAFITACGVLAYFRPDLTVIWLSFLFFVAINLFQSSFTRFCLMEKILRRLGFRSEMDEIRNLALHDPLTQLPNRKLLEERIETAISQSKRNGKKVATLFIDLDHFKQINDIHGHKVGDRLLLAVSEALQSRLREYDTLSRWGGDEFVALLPDIDKVEDVHAIGLKLMKAVTGDLLDDVHCHTSLSIGAAVYPDDAHCCDTLLVQADKALFYSKSQGRNNIQIFSEIEKKSLSLLDLELTTRFTTALNQRQIQVHYQPIVDIDNYKVVGIEALARWLDGDNGWVSPAEFIPLAENIGLIHQVGDLVIEKSLAYFSGCSWNEHVQLSINISNRQLLSKNFIKSLNEKLNKFGIKPGQLTLEITESTMLDIEKTHMALKELSDTGYCISVDDFGTGFSSLSRLHDMPVDELKIDMSFIKRIHTNEGNVMVKTIVDMGHAMNMSIVAEGVEDMETVNILTEMGVDKLQGYHFCRPKPKNECTQFINSNIADTTPSNSEQASSAFIELRGASKK